MKTTTNIYNGKGVLTKCDSFRINFDLGTLWRSSNLSFFVARNFFIFFYLFLPWSLVGQPTRFFVEFSFPLGWRSSSWSRPGHLFVNVTAPFLFSLCFSLAFELSFHFHTNWHSVFPQIATYLLVTVMELRLCSWGKWSSTCSCIIWYKYTMNTYFQIDSSNIEEKTDLWRRCERQFDHSLFLDSVFSTVPHKHPGMWLS